MKLLSKSELLFVMTIIALFCFSGTMLVYDSFFADKFRTGEKVGTITYKNKFAEQKPGGSTLWTSLIQDGPVFNKDTIRTGPGSTAIIHLDNKTQITLNEESMVLINLIKKDATIKLTGGTVLIDSEKNDGSVKLQTRSGDLTVQGGHLQVKDTAAGVKLQVKGGSSQISRGTNSTPVLLEQNKNYDVSTAKATPMDVILRTPNTGAILVSAADETNIAFAWDDLTPTGTTSSKTHTLLVSKDTNFTNLEYSRDNASSGTILPLTEGIHYWKLSDSPETGWFTIKKGERPKIISPINERFPRLDTPISVGFTWRKTSDTDLYRIEIYKEPAATTPLISKILDRTTAMFQISDEGTYSWKIIALVGPNQTEFASPSEEFSIVNDKLATPEFSGTGRTPGAVLQLSTFAAGKGKPITGWYPVPNAEKYTVRISSDPEGKSAAADYSTRSTFLTLTEPLSVGNYYLAVQALSGIYSSDFSNSLKLEIIPIIPLVSIAPLPEELIPLAKKPLLFSWKDPNNGSRYRLLVAQTSDFSSPLVAQDTDKRALAAQLPPGVTGKLYWKAMLLDDTDSRVTETPVGSFRIEKIISPPIPEFPIRGENIDVNTLKNITLRWRQDAQPRQYTVHLYRMTGGLKSPIAEWTTTENTLVISDFSKLALDSFAWDIAAQETDPDGSTITSQPVTSYFRIIQKTRLSVPKIRRMTSRGEY